MSKEIEFKYFLNGVETKKEIIDWNRSLSIIPVRNTNEVHVTYMGYVTDNSEEKDNCGMSTRHKACKTDYPKTIPQQNITPNNIQKELVEFIRGLDVSLPIDIRRTSSADELTKPAQKSLTAQEKRYLKPPSFQDCKARGVLKEDELVGVKESDGKLSYELDWSFLTQMAERMSTNKDKYPPYNWKKPMDVEKLKQATFRHMLEIMNSNYEDEGRLQGHLEALALNAMMINYQLKNNK